MASTASDIESKLAPTTAHAIKAVAVVHNETSTGVATRIPRSAPRSTAPAIRRCFMVDTISSLASIDYRHDEWGVDVTVAGSQKGLMLPPGLSFNAVSEKALAASEAGEAAALVLGLGRDDRAEPAGYFPSTPATNLLYGLHEALAMLRQEGLPTCSRGTSATPRRRAARCAPGGSRSCARSGRVQLVADRGRDARGP